MSTQREKLIDRLNSALMDWEDYRPCSSMGEHVVNYLGLTQEVESYAVPDSTRRRWVTDWEEG